MSADKEADLGDRFPCDSCAEGFLIWEKNGAVCQECLEPFCEACCDQGLFGENDEFICKGCLEEVYKNGNYDVLIF